jgi:hypothetical protein
MHVVRTHASASSRIRHCLYPHNALRCSNAVALRTPMPHFFIAAPPASGRRDAVRAIDQGRVQYVAQGVEDVVQGPRVLVSVT